MTINTLYASTISSFFTSHHFLLFLKLFFSFTGVYAEILRRLAETFDIKYNTFFVQFALFWILKS